MDTKTSEVSAVQPVADLTKASDTSSDHKNDVANFTGNSSFATQTSISSSTGNQDPDNVHTQDSTDAEVKTPSAADGNKTVVDVSKTSEKAAAPNMTDDDWTNLVGKVQAYLQGELSLTVGDYRLLEQMNRCMQQKYEDMMPAAQHVHANLQNLGERYRALQPLLDKVDQIETQVLELEKTAYSLDAYSRQLEARFKTLNKPP